MEGTVNRGRTEGHSRRGHPINAHVVDGPENGEVVDVRTDVGGSRTVSNGMDPGENISSPSITKISFKESMSFFFYLLS